MSEKHEKMRISDKLFKRIGFSHTFCVSHLSHRENVQHFVGDIRMNLFYLDWDINEIVKSMNNKHIVKMPLESAQMLCTAHWCCNRNVKELADLYKPVHVNHPTTIWTRESATQYSYHYNLFLAMCEEYTFRYGKVHASEEKFRGRLEKPPEKIADIITWREPPQCMPDDCKVEGSAILAYRQYYKKYKIGFSRPQDYLKRERPSWLD